MKCSKLTLKAAYEGDPAAARHEEVIVAYPFVEAVAIQRVAHLLYSKRLPLIPRIMTEWAHSRTGIDLSPGTEIGSHFFIDHGTGVVIGETSKIGSHVKLYQGVALIAGPDRSLPVRRFTAKNAIRALRTMSPSIPAARSWEATQWSARAVRSGPTSSSRTAFHHVSRLPR